MVKRGIERYYVGLRGIRCMGRARHGAGDLMWDISRCLPGWIRGELTGILPGWIQGEVGDENILTGVPRS